MRSGQGQVLRPVGLVARAVGREVHLVGDIEVRLSVLDCAGLLVGEVPAAQLGERLDRRGCAQRGQPLVEVALHAVLEHHRTVFVLSLRVVGARAGVPTEEALLRILLDDARDVGWIDDDGALPLQNRDRLRHHLRRIGVETAAGLTGPRRRDLVVVEGARDADARALQGAGR